MICLRGCDGAFGKTAWTRQAPLPAPLPGAISAICKTAGRGEGAYSGDRGGVAEWKTPAVCRSVTLAMECFAVVGICADEINMKLSLAA